MKAENTNSAKLVSRDLISIAIFSVIIQVVLFVVAAIFGMIIPLYPFATAIDGLICGIVYMYLRAKTPKHWAILLQAAVNALLLFLFGTMWTMPAGIFVGGLIAEFVSRPKENRSFFFNMIGYCFVMLGFAVGSYAPIVFAKEWYAEYITGAGMPTDYAGEVFSLLNGPLFYGALALTVTGSIAGAFIGRAMLKKHFEKAGIV
jgi:energy-coupling factor transport system substrate-specific component